MADWKPDDELAGYDQLTIDLPGAATYQGEPSEVVATLVRRDPATRSRAVLYLHGWNDYYFHTHVADELVAAGYDFYALELRRYGRSLRNRQLAGFVTDMTDYFVELDAALELIKAEGHDEVVFYGHSTGGLIGALWANARQGALRALVLNSPWLEIQGSAVLRPALSPVVSAAGNLSPTAVMPMAENGFYKRTINADEDGLWRYNLAWKGDKAFLVRAGWMAAILRAQGKVAAGLKIDCPVLVATSHRSDFRTRWSEELLRTDIVLDVERIRERALDLGPLVTLLQVDGGLHDLSLSFPEPRAEFFLQMRRWLVAYG